MPMLMLLILLFASPAWADWGVTLDFDQSTATGNELFVDGNQFITGTFVALGGATFTSGQVTINSEPLALDGGVSSGVVFNNTAIAGSACVMGSGIQNALNFSSTGLVECAVGVEHAITIANDWDTCSEVRTNLGSAERTGTCGKVVFSTNPTIDQLHGSGPTSTPGATPTATSATATATAVTPTPTATRTPAHNFDDDVGIDGNVTLVGNATRSINVGPCTRSPCAGKAFTSASGAGVGDGVGGSYDITSGAGVNLKNAGNITHTAGSGGASMIETMRRGFLNTGGLFKIFGDFILGIAASGSRPTFGAGCGSTASDALATNNQGRITMSGTGQTGSCVVTFGNGGFTNAPACFAQFSTDGGAVGHAITTVVDATTTVTINNAVLATGIAQNFAANDIVKYWCVGRE